MPWFEINLNVKKNVSRSKFEDEVLCWMISLIKFEHIYENYSSVWKEKSKLILEVEATRHDSLLLKWFNKYILQDYQKMNYSLTIAPKLTALDYYKKTKNIGFSKVKELYLFTNQFQDFPCLKEGENEIPVPIYLLPINPDKIEEIYFWKKLYKNHDAIELSCRDLEIPAYKQMALPKSGLSEEGRGLCKEIELATKKPTYYFLVRYWGWKNKKKESNRPCPSCGKAWRNKKMTKFGINSFDFKCKPCRLISYNASTFDNEKYAQIGYSK